VITCLCLDLRCHGSMSHSLRCSRVSRCRHLQQYQRDMVYNSAQHSSISTCSCHCWEHRRLCRGADPIMFVSVKAHCKTQSTHTHMLICCRASLVSPSFDDSCIFQPLTPTPSTFTTVRLGRGLRLPSALLARILQPLLRGTLQSSRAVVPVVMVSCS
jgi:hypothetical protein